MLNDSNTNVERIIAKIDNDFNPDNSDWIPRVGAWCIDAMSMIDVMPRETKRFRLKVNNRIAYSSETLPNNVKVYDCNGCEISNMKTVTNTSGCGCKSSHSSTGSQVEVNLSNTMSYVENNEIEETIPIATTEPGSYPEKHSVDYISIRSNNKSRNYILVNNRQIELNYDTDCIEVEFDAIKTSFSEQYCCELPVIPNNGLLIEAIANFCMYKMLCRGYKHPVFNLAASQYGTNPYFIWLQLKDQAKRSVINDGLNEDLTKLWRSAFFISTFDPRR